MRTVRVEGEEIAPLKIVCVGRNYVEHIHELGNEVPEEMVIFCKPNSAIGETLAAVHLEPLHYEAEICYLVKDGALAAVGCGLDLTKRGLQSRLKGKGLPWERAKAFDGAALFSPFVKLADPQAVLGLELLVDGKLRQKGSTAQMIHKPGRILAEVSRFMSLDDGDILMTGTPAGVGPVTAGELFELRLLGGDRQLVSCRWLAR